MQTKRLLISLIGLLTILSAYTNTKNLDQDVTMVSYEQNCFDHFGTLALKNNTNEEIYNIKFQITYLDMSGTPLDYEDFTRTISIAPGMTKKLDIPAYEFERYYHYYKSKERLSDSPSFKIKFQLIDYNVKQQAPGNSHVDDSLENRYFKDSVDKYSHPIDTINEDYGFSAIIFLVALVIIIGISVGLYVLVAVMAQKRNRNVVIWILLSLLASPLLMIIILLFIGKDKNKD